MKSIAFVLVLAILVSGCQGAPAPKTKDPSDDVYRYAGYDGPLPFTIDAEGNETPSGPTLPTWGFLQDKDATSESLAANSKGALFRTAGDTVWRSGDQGRTWRPVREYEQVPAPLSPDLHASSSSRVAVDAATDRLFVLHRQADGFCFDIAYSDDEGGTWTQHPYACSHPTPDILSFAGVVSVGIRVVTGAPPPSEPVQPRLPHEWSRTLYVCMEYHAYALSGSAFLGAFCSASRDAGRTFVETRVPCDPRATITWEGLEQVVTLPDGRLIVACRMHASVSVDGGLTWTLMEYPPGFRIQDTFRIAVDKEGALYFLRVPLPVLRDKNGRLLPPSPIGREGLVLARTADLQTWTTIGNATPRNLQGILSRSIGLVAGDGGRIAYTFVGTTISIDKAEARPGEQSTWTVPWHWYGGRADLAGTQPYRFALQRITPHDRPYAPDLPGKVPLQPHFSGVVDSEGRPYFATPLPCTSRNGCAADTYAPARDAQWGFSMQLAGPGLRTAPSALPELNIPAQEPFGAPTPREAIP